MPNRYGTPEGGNTPGKVYGPVTAPPRKVDRFPRSVTHCGVADADCDAVGNARPLQGAGNRGEQLRECRLQVAAGRGGGGLCDGGGLGPQLTMVSGLRRLSERCHSRGGR
ncbi:Uncharacterised protein [Mycobacterium tuberculosis]|nr:Uncharacterised protein [Mycobacterium tuberculosis]CKY36069.1 Uncharacterised protein [Mycobacterium tuberculosis]CKY95513.1 Uncharacterised protein [Mycobacterium tuberculosis]CNY73372.1 Uncharacterised protein [Mycobacterium tuberculosis]COV09199.1 Uncharacterised protein [Mycobacterium tuberculosis]